MLGSILSAVGSIAGGLFGQKKAQKAADKAANKNYQQQKEFAQNSLNWKAKDAERAGISKVFAMGAPTASFSPSNVGGGNFDFLADAGQNIGRALASAPGLTPGGGTTAVSKAAQAIALESGQLDNELKRAQIASISKTFTQPGTPPPYSIDGPTLKLQTNRDLSAPDRWTVPGSGPDVVMTNTNSGGMTWDTPPQLAESRESDHWLKTTGNFVRNGLMPFANPHTRVPQAVIDALPPGTTPRFNPFTQEWYAVRGRDRHLSIPYGFRKGN